MNCLIIQTASHSAPSAGRMRLKSVFWQGGGGAEEPLAICHLSSVHSRFLFQGQQK